MQLLEDESSVLLLLGRGQSAGGRFMEKSSDVRVFSAPSDQLVDVYKRLVSSLRELRGTREAKRIMMDRKSLLEKHLKG